MAEIETVTSVLHFTEPASAADITLALRPINPGTDKQALLDLYFIAFHKTHEFNGWPLEEILQQAESDINSALANLHPQASCLAEDQEMGTIVGAALIDEDGTHLRHIMIDPTWQRQGLGTAMLHSVTATLSKAEKTSLRSCYALGNEPSRKWHQSMGFDEQQM